MKYWLFKTEPGEFSIDDLAKCPRQTTRWDGIRNYQARNFLRDQTSINDPVLLYHSSCKPTAVVGVAVIVSPPYPDPAQFDSKSPYFDEKTSVESPRWYSVDIRLEQVFPSPVELTQIKAESKLGQMILLKRGRLSVQPVTAAEFKLIVKLGGGK